MPKIYLNCPEGTFSNEAKDALAEDITSLALAIEKLPNTPYVRSTVWIFVNEYPLSNVYHGGQTGGTKIISIEVNALKGGLDTAAKILLIKEFTKVAGKHAGMSGQNPIPVYIVIRDVDESNWGIFGKTISLNDIRNPPPGEKPL